MSAHCNQRTLWSLPLQSAFCKYGCATNMTAHTCPVCHREYSTKGSLTRHVQNHQKSRSHTCAKCNVTYYRPDLLSRHVRMHHGSSADLDDGKGRLRSRTACDACRRARTKCKGNLPCTRCHEKSLNCVVNPKSGRVSTDLRVQTNSSLADGPTAMPESSDDPAATITNDLVLSTDVSVANHSPLMSIEATVEGIQSVTSPDTSSPNTVQWSWLHEDIFLPNDVNLDWYEMPALFQFEQEASEGGGFHPPQDGALSDPIATEVHQDQPIDALQDTNTDASSQQNAYASTFGGSREEYVSLLVEKASRCTKTTPDDTSTQLTFSTFFTELSSAAFEIQARFDIGVVPTSMGTNHHSSHCLDHLLQLYFKNFWTLWPLVPKYHCNGQQFHPLLYLTMVSIGAMYGGKGASTFGTVLHESLRAVLVRPFFDYDIADRDLLPLGQARSLTQAAALYFGQKRAFSYAQHIGGVLVSQGRKMNIFSIHASPFAADAPHRSSTQWLKSWIRKESSKRLAFAILRLEMYTSCLHFSRPLISGHELEIELPCSRFLWYGDFSSHETFVNAIQQEQSMKTSTLLFSDLMMIALDGDENLPHLSLLDQELMMNGMQEHIWAACMARESLERLVPASLVSEMEKSGIWNASPNYMHNSHCGSLSTMLKTISNHDHLVHRPRIMSTLSQKIVDVTKALAKWYDSCLTSISPSSVADRSSLLSCILIYHMSFLQLHAPLALIHTMFHLPLSTNATSHDNVAKILAWAASKRALTALKHAKAIFETLKLETRKSVESRANFNFLSMIGLYHSAAVLWVFSDISIASLNSEHSFIELGVDGQRIEISQANTSFLMESVVTLFKEINPAWAPRSSFCAAVQRLSGMKFSQIDTNATVQ